MTADLSLDVPSPGLAAEGASAPVLRIAGLAKHFGGLRALNGVDFAVGTCLKQERNVEDSHLGPRAFRFGKESSLSLLYQGVHDRFELPECRRISKDMARKLGPIDTAVELCAWERLLDRRDSFPLVKRVYDGIGIEHRYPSLHKETGRGAFAHSDRASETENHHVISPPRPRCGGTMREEG